MDNWPTRALIATHAIAAAAKWAVVPGVLVHGFAWGGARAVGVVSLALLVPLFVGAPLVGAAQARWSTHRTRLVSQAGQAVAYGSAALASVLEAPTPVVAPLVVGGFCAFMLTAPTTAALLPEVARSADAMVRANLWVTYGDSASGLTGSLLAALALGLGGPTPVFATAAVGVSIGWALTAWRASARVRSARTTNVAQGRHSLRRTIGEFRSHSWGRAVVVLLGARNLLLGAFDVLLVIVALDSLDLGQAGPGYLSALVGAGALGSTLVTTQVVRRAWLRGALVVAVSFSALTALTLGVRIDRPVVLVVLPLLGIAMAMIDALSRMVMIRSTDPRRVAPLYASLSVLDGVSQVVGSVVAQVALAVGDAQLAFLVMGVLLAALVASVIRSLARADDDMAIPVVEMALLSSQPMLSAVSTRALEQLARSATTVAIPSGETLTAEGDRVDACYVIADGEVSVSLKGRALGAGGRGDVVGEVALLSGMAATTSVVASSDVTALRIERRMFLLALTGQDMAAAGEAVDLTEARGRFREVVAAQQRLSGPAQPARPELWVGLGAAGRVLEDPTFPEVLVRGANLADETNNDAALAQAAALAIWPGAFFFVADNPDQALIDLCRRGLDELDAHDPLRVRVLAALASNLAFAAPLDERRELIDEAHAIAESHADAELVGVALNAEFVSMWEPATFARRAEIGPALVEIAGELEDPELEYVARFLDAFCMAERGDVGRARHELIALSESAGPAHNEYYVFLTERLLLSIDIAQGRDGVRDRIDALAVRHADSIADTDGTWALQVGGLAYEDGTFAGMATSLAGMLDGPHARTWSAALALAHVHAGDRDAAMEVMAAQDEIPRSYFWISVMQTRAEAASALGMTDLCQELFDQLLPFRHHLGITASGSRIFGLVARSLGELASVLGRHDEAVELLGDAVSRAEDAGLAYEAVACARLLAQALHARGDHAVAAAMAEQTLRRAADGGYQREVALLQPLLSAAP